MPFVHKPDFKARCKALVLAGRYNAVQVAEAMAELENVHVTPDSVYRWVKDASIEPDMEFVRAFARQIDAKVVGYVDELTSKLRARIDTSIGRFDEDGAWLEGTGAKAFDLHQDVKSLSFLTNLVRPANASGGGGGGHFQVNVQGPQIVLPFEAREQAGEQIQAPPPADPVLDVAFEPTVLQIGGSDGQEGGPSEA